MHVKLPFSDWSRIFGTPNLNFLVLALQPISLAGTLTEFGGLFGMGVQNFCDPGTHVSNISHTYFEPNGPVIVVF